MYIFYIIRQTACDADKHVNDPIKTTWLNEALKFINALPAHTITSARQIFTETSMSVQKRITQRSAPLPAQEPYRPQGPHLCVEQLRLVPRPLNRVMQVLRREAPQIEV